MNTFLKITNFLRITDENNVLSLTNILIVGMSIKLFLAPEIDIPTITAFIFTLLQYSHKRVVNAKIKPVVIDTTAIEATIAKVDSDMAEQKEIINKLALQAGIKKLL